MEPPQSGLCMPLRETHLSPTLAASVLALNPHFNSQVLHDYPHPTGEETEAQGGPGPSPGHTAGRVPGRDWSPSAPDSRAQVLTQHTPTASLASLGEEGSLEQHLGAPVQLQAG